MIYYDKELFTALRNGARGLARAVGSTMGPRGRPVIVCRNGITKVTKDGVSVAKEYRVDSPIENLAASLIRQAATETVEAAGDGTTTATVLAAAILTEAERFLGARGVAPIEIKRGMDEALADILENLNDMSEPVKTLDQLKSIATIAANGDKKIGDMIATAFFSVGKDGAINIRRETGASCSVEAREGYILPGGWCSSKFANTAHGTVEYKQEVLVLVTDLVIEDPEQILPALALAGKVDRPLVFAAAEITGGALAALVANHKREDTEKIRNLCAVRAPRHYTTQQRHEFLSDLALATGATFFSQRELMDLSEFRAQDFGVCTRFIANARSSIYIGGAADEPQVEARITALTSEMKIEEGERAHLLAERIAKLRSNACVITAGAPTSAETGELADRIEDALESLRHSDTGVVPGGGVALIRAASSLDVAGESSRALGRKILRVACEAPLRQLAENADLSADMIVAQVTNLEGNHGVDLTTGESGDMVEAGIIDPVHVTRTALKSAVSVASTLLTTNCAMIVDD